MSPTDTLPVVPDWMVPEYNFARHSLLVDGGRMHYIDAGEGEAVLMLHGNPTWSYYYRSVIRKLQGNYRCIVPDHIGCGLSDKPQEWSYRLEDHIQNVEKLVEHLKLKKVHIVVHDWGGAIGMGFATRHPGMVGKIIITNTAAFRSDWMPLQIRVCRIPFVGEWFIRAFNGFAGSATFMAVVKRMPKAVRKGLCYPYNNWENRIATHRFVADIPMQSDHPSWRTIVSIESNLHKLKEKEMAILWGLKDFCFTEYFLKKWIEFFPKAHVRRFADAGHYLFEDESELVPNSIESFLNSD